MASTADHIVKQRDIIDRKSLAETLDEIASERETRTQRGRVLEQLQAALAQGRAEIDRRLQAHPSQGYRAATEQAFLIDQIVRLIYDYVTVHVYPAANRSASERVAVLAVGGTDGGFGGRRLCPRRDGAA